MHQILDLEEVSFQKADQASRLVDQLLWPDHGLLELLHGLVYAQNLIQPSSNHLG